MSERALREIYLYPLVRFHFNRDLVNLIINFRFMLAQKHAQPAAYMTSYCFRIFPSSSETQKAYFPRYGRINGVHCSENKRLLTDILRKEWKFQGIVISDW